MSIIRTVHNKDNPYTIISKAPINDENLSFKALGLWTWALSKPDGWFFYIKNICKMRKEGRDSVASAIKELIDNRYCVRVKVRHQGKFCGVEYLFFENKISDKELQDILKQYPDTYRSDFKIISPKPDFPMSENPPLNNIEELEKKEDYESHSLTNISLPKPDPTPQKDFEYDSANFVVAEQETLTFSHEKKEDKIMEDQEYIAIVDRFKLNASQSDTFAWLLSQKIDTPSPTLAYYAKRHSKQKLQDWLSECHRRNPRSIGAYLRTLINKDAQVATDTTKAHAQLIVDYLNAQNFHGYEIRDKFAILYYPDGRDKEIPLHRPPDSILAMLNNFMDALERSR